MKFNKSVLVITLAGFLAACGGGGYYDNTSTNGENTIDPSETPSTADQQKVFNALKVEAASLFGQANSEKKGYIDHALDTYAESVLKISQDIRNVNITAFKNTHRLEKCFANSTTDFRACYVFKGNEIRNLLGSKYDG
ncbi:MULTISPECIES: hypothetical protein [unclassified Acinetobacter]|nr:MULTISPECIES: hypothetical protein [unclassified Acinetobacter]